MKTELTRPTRRLGLVATMLAGSMTLGGPAPSLPEIPTEFADAPAVVLEHEITWSLWPGKSSTRVKKRVLIRRDAGNDQADQSVVYVRPVSELHDFAARTIQPDGSVVPVPEPLQHDLTAYRSDDREVRVVLFTFPAVLAGSILEWEYEVRFQDRSYFQWWEVQESIPVLHTDFEIRFHNFPNEKLRIGPQSRTSFDAWCDRQPTESGTNSVVRRYACRDVPAYEREPLAPPENQARVRLLMSWRPSSAPSLNRVLWRSIGREWQDNIQRLCKKDGDARQLVARLRSNAESDAKLVDLVLGWVKDHLEIRDLSFEDDLGKGRGESASVAEILERGGGTPNEVAIVTLALLLRAGIDVRPVLVGNRIRERLDWKFPDPPGDLHVLLEVVTDGKTVFLDPGCDLCGPRVPDWRYCAGPSSGIRLDLEFGNVSIADVPPMHPLRNSERFRDEIRLDAHGLASVEGSVRWFGQHDMTVRAAWKDLTPSGREDSLRNRIAGDIEEFEVRSSDPSEFRGTLLAEYDYKRHDLALLVEDRLLIAPPDVFTTRLALPMQEERKLPVWWIYPHSLVQEAVFTLPEGFEVGALPDRTRLTGPGLTYQGQWKREQDTGRLRWEAILKYERLELGPSEYPKARRFATDLLRALRQGVVARRGERASSEEAR